MKKNILPLFAGCILFASCKKDELAPLFAPVEACVHQTGKPSGSYAKDSVVAYMCTQKLCGVLPLSTRNYWIYQDSIFSDGVLMTVQLDTLRYSTTTKSVSDGLVWWESNRTVGLPERLYANDSSLYKLEERLFTEDILDAKKEFGLFQGDSLRYLTNFEDAAAQGRSLKLGSTVKTPAGDFDNCLYFEKNARNYRKDQVFFKPGIGVLKYIQEKAPMGERDIKLQQVSTLVAYHIE